MQVKEGGKIDVEEVVAVTMGPESAVRALHKAVSLGADRSVHLTDESLAGSDVCATGYALAQVLKTEQPDLVLLGQQSDDGECYTIGAVVADHLQMPSLTQVIKMEVEDGKLVCERQAEYGYDTVEVELPAVISVGDAINEPRYPSLKAIMGAKKKQLDTKATGDAGIEADKVGEAGSTTEVLAINPPPEKQAGEIIEDEDTDETVQKIVAWLEERKLLGMSGILDLRHSTTRGVQQELARRRLRGREAGAGSWARRPTPSSSAAMTSPTTSQDARQVRRHEGLARQRPGGPRRPGGRRHGQADPGQRLRLRAVRRRPARLRDRRRPHRAPRRRRDHGGHRGQGRRTASSSPSGRSSRTRRSSTWATRAARASSSAA